MKGLYEQNWKNALKGAKIEPSKALWENITSTLDKEKGRNYWVTILMIAATVTIAFSFPLTIGDSAFKAHPNTYQPIVQSDANNSNYSSKDANLYSVDSSSKNSIFKKPSAKNNDLDNAQNYLASAGKINNKESLDLTSNAEPANFALAINAKTKRSGFDFFDWNNNFQLTNLKSYYILPYFMPLKKSGNRTLLASLNMGTGNSSTNGGAFNNMLESDMAAPLLNLTDKFSDTAEKNESNGTTFYIGGGIELPIGNRWSLLTGIGYLSQKAEGVNNVVKNGKNGYQPLGIYDPIGAGSVFLSESYHYTLTNNYITIPISVKYPIINRKIKFRIGTGISTDFMLNHIVNSETYNRASYKPSEVDYKPIVVSGLINLDVSYSLSKHYSIALETGFRKGITPIDKRKELYPASFTVGIIVFYKIQ